MRSIRESLHQLTTAAFNTGITDLRNTLENNSVDQLQCQRDKDNRSFTAKHGDALATRVRDWCNVNTDAALPYVHRLLAKSDGKARDYGIIQAAIEARVLANVVPLSWLTHL